MLRKIRLYGHLAEHCGQKVFEAVARTPAEAIRFLLCNFPELRSIMNAGHYTVAVGPHTLELGESPHQLGYPLTASDDIRIIPVVTGANLFRNLAFIALGAVLIGTALATAGVSLGATGFVAGAAIAAFLSAGVCPLKVLVGANSPNLCPTISSEIVIGIKDLPL